MSLKTVTTRWLISLTVVFWGGSALAESARVFVAGKGGVFGLDLDLKTGALVSKGISAELGRPTFLTLHPSGWFLYASNNEGEGEGEAAAGQAVAFFVEPGSGALQELNRSETGGAGAAHIELDARGKLALAANYGGGSVAAFRIGLDGRFSERTDLAEHLGSSVLSPRQDQPHPHSARISADERFAYAPDLGTDEIFIYQIDHQNAKLVPTLDPVAKVDEGSGPRHFDFHPTLPVAYVINEIVSNVTVFRRDLNSGALTALQTISTLPKDASAKNSTAEIRVHPGGKFVYGSNRGHDSIAVFAVDEKGFLKLVETEPSRGNTPRHFAIAPGGKWLIAANQGSDSLAVFAIDEATGKLSPVGDLVEVPGPRCIAIAPPR